MTAPTVTPDTTAVQHQDDGDNLAHLVLCHDEDTAYCGRDLTGVRWAYATPVDDVCVVCLDMHRTMPCGCACGCCGPEVTS